MTPRQKTEEQGRDAHRKGLNTTLLCIFFFSFMSVCYMPGPGAMKKNTASVPVIQEFTVMWDRKTDG